LKIYGGKNGAYPQCPTRFLGFEEFFRSNSDKVQLVVGGGFDSQEVKNFKIANPDVFLILIEFDEPNRFFYTDKNSVTNKLDYQDAFDQILTICPYTAKWLNTKFNSKKRIPVFFPFNEHFIPKDQPKKYDVIYTGHILAKPILEIAMAMSHFNYAIVSNSDHPLVNKRGVDHQEKMNLIRESKITVVQNLHFMDPFHIANLQLIDDFKDSEAYRLVPKKSMFQGTFVNVLLGAAGRIVRKFQKTFYDKPIFVPQIKSRAFEAAFGKSLMLVQRDPFNIIEQFFTPGKEFVYYEQGQLKEKIDEILRDFQTYQPVIDNAYDRAVNEYTSRVFYKKYLERYDQKAEVEARA
jgi:hypothetical protein